MTRRGVLPGQASDAGSDERRHPDSETEETLIVLEPELFSALFAATEQGRPPQISSGRGAHSPQC